MGGVTITKVADTEDELKNIMLEQIDLAIRNGLWPDSDLVILKPSENYAKIFKLKERSFGFDLVEVKEGRAFHVGVAAKFGERPKPGQFVGTIHVHT